MLLENSDTDITTEEDGAKLQDEIDSLMEENGKLQLQIKDNLQQVDVRKLNVWKWLSAVGINESSTDYILIDWSH